MFAQNMLLVGSAGGPAGDGADLIGTMSGYTLGAITVSALGESTASVRAWKAFDKGTSSPSRWRHAVSTWLKVDFGSSQVAYSYMLQGEGLTRDPAAWTFEGSDNDSAWTTLDTQSGIGTSSAEQDFSLSKRAEYRYYRWSFTAMNGGSTVGIKEAQIRS